MTSRSRDTSTVDWEAAEAVAERLGVHTRQLVGGRHVETARDWCLRMARENGDTRDPRRSLSYYELAAVLGHREPAADKLAGREWSELLGAVQEIAGTVRVKAAAEEAAAKAEAEAAAKAAAEAAEAEAAEELEDDSTEDGEDGDPDRHTPEEEVPRKRRSPSDGARHR